MDKREWTFTAAKIHGTEAHQIASEEEPDTQPSVPKVDVNLVFGKEQTSDSINTELGFFQKSSSASIRLEDDDVGKSQQPGPLEKAPCNVRKLVSAFESSLPKVLQAFLALACCCMRFFKLYMFFSSYKIQGVVHLDSSRM